MKDKAFKQHMNNTKGTRDEGELAFLKKQITNSKVKELNKKPNWVKSKEYDGIQLYVNYNIDSLYHIILYNRTK